MNVLGIRCSNKDYTYAILTGTKTNPRIIDTQTLPYPSGFPTAESLKWLLQEIEGLIIQYDIKRITMNKSETRVRGNDYEHRVEHEAIVYIASLNKGVKCVDKKVKGSIAKDLGLKGRASSLLDTSNTSLIKDFDNYSKKSQDAIFAGWSKLD